MIEMWEHKTDHGLWKLHSPRWLKIITQLGLRHEKGLMMHQFGSRLALVHDEEEVTEALWILFSMALLDEPSFPRMKILLCQSILSTELVEALSTCCSWAFASFASECLMMFSDSQKMRSSQVQVVEIVLLVSSLGYRFCLVMLHPMGGQNCNFTFIDYFTNARSSIWPISWLFNQREFRVLPLVYFQV